ncbi:glycosyltransferase family 32 protein [Ilyonectria robusta]
MSRLSLFRPRSLVVLAWLSTAVLVLIAASSAYGRNARPSDPFIPASVANHGASRPSGTCPPASSSTPAANRPGLAPALSPAELLCRPAANPAIVPKLFHQSWKTTQLPAKFQRWSDSCREKHPDWEWVLWTDEDNLRLVKEHFPWLLDTYLNLPGSIYRADLARNLYMYQFGGVYADLDTECLRSTVDGLEDYSIPFSNGVNDTSTGTEDAIKIALFGRMGTDQTYEQSIPNAWMAASPGHPFFLRALEFAHAELEKSKSFLRNFWHKTPNAEHMTGPIALRKTIIAYGASSEEDEIVLLPGRLVYPYNWKEHHEFLAVCSAEQATFDDAVCKEKLEVVKKKSISITYWSHTHKGQGSDAHNIGLISSDK